MAAEVAPRSTRVAAPVETRRRQGAARAGCYRFHLYTWSPSGVQTTGRDQQPISWSEDVTKSCNHGNGLSRLQVEATRAIDTLSSHEGEDSRSVAVKHENKILDPWL
ncbi:hypothetical protein RRG08_058227 [Elysia crispata]|uniref:Uncharacterized protein n=1 Tax=Elysia crispata TaxID=231223 RepID=A0AAE0YUN1_9GAST|nr:hypothetical protein RRG08_058227 [Elysia crispata]